MHRYYGNIQSKSRDERGLLTKPIRKTQYYVFLYRKNRFSRLKKPISVLEVFEENLFVQAGKVTHPYCCRNIRIHETVL